MTTFGIEDLSVALPALYLPIEDLADARGIEPAKLRHGLGLINMALCDVDEDVITLAARATIDLITKNSLSPADIGRIYVGTESSVDGSKPIASYVLGLVKNHFDVAGVSTSQLNRCDVVDLTFACIGAVDAMHNSLAWLHTPAAQGKVAIVVATDDAKYELDSTGEYTQGAGAVAVLLKAEPRLMSIDLAIGVSSCDEHDFFKPLRLHKNATDFSNAASDTLMVEHKETPIFDGPFSNKTYTNRIVEAYEHYKEQHESTTLADHAKYVFHLPYSYHGRRIFPELYFQELKELGLYDDYLEKNGLTPPDSTLDKETYKGELRAFLKARTKTTAFKALLADKITQGEQLSSEVGNVYTASIFLALMSTLFHSKEENLADQEVLFLAYGSGSKAKVFSGQLMPQWAEVVNQWPLADQLSGRTAVTFDEYIDIRCHTVDSPLAGCKDIAQKASGVLPTNRYAKYYTI